MPTYEYECRACGELSEIFHGVSVAPKKKCPRCGKNQLKKLISAGSGFIFKGSGFYITDYRSDSYKEAAKAEQGSASGKSEGSGQGEGGGAPEGAAKTESGGEKSTSKDAVATGAASSGSSSSGSSSTGSSSSNGSSPSAAKSETRAAPAAKPASANKKGGAKARTPPGRRGSH